MLFRVPKGYSAFRCLGSLCQDNCCIGWEIDIDPATLDKYRQERGEFSPALLGGIHIAETGEASFKLGENERCTFLNDNNLCEISLRMGEDALCEICRSHPRFFEWFGPIKEGGLGLCCEEAARIWFRREKVFPLDQWEIPEKTEEELPFWYDALFFVREKIFCLLENEELPIFQRLFLLLKLCREIEEGMGRHRPQHLFAVIKEFFERDLSCAGYVAWNPSTALLSGLLELYSGFVQLDSGWGDKLKRAKENLPELLGKRSGFLAKEENIRWLIRMAEYIIYRYFLKACYDECVEEKGWLAVSSCLLLLLLALEKGAKLRREDREALAKAYSKEVEYCEENMEALTKYCRDMQKMELF